MRQAMREIDSAEFTEWMAYYSLEPFGSPADDVRHGIAASTLANINRNPKQRKKPYEVADFVPWHEDHLDKKESGPVLLDDPDQQTAALMNVMFGGMNVVYAS